MRQLAAIATSSPIWCAGFWRTARTPPSCPSRPTPTIPVAALLQRPADIIGRPEAARNLRVPLPSDLYGLGRRNSAGVELGHRDSLDELMAEVRAGAAGSVKAAPLVDGIARSGKARPVLAPADATSVVGEVREADAATADAAMEAARKGFRAWERTPAGDRAEALLRAADLLEQKRGRFLALLQSEAGKTIDDAIAELREAVDFCRYYAAQARGLFGEGEVLPGPTGEDNRLLHRGRGVFLCISPWNFPLAIFLGQVSAALAAGNSRGRQARRADARLSRLRRCRRCTRRACPFPRCTSSPATVRWGRGSSATSMSPVSRSRARTETARRINRALAAKDGPIVPLIAETGGINAMIVDATALPEQVADDVVTSAFRSAGQRCSALRLLCVQEDVADKMIEMIVGAAQRAEARRPPGYSASTSAR